MRGLEQSTHPTAGGSRTRRLRAIRISRAIRGELLVPGPLGTVASVHRSAINVRRGRRMLTVALDSVGGLPNGITISSEVPLDRIGVCPDMAVQRDGLRLSVPEASLAISLAAAADWSPLMSSFPRLPTADRSTRAARAFDAAAADAGVLGLGPLISGLAGVPSASTSRLIDISTAALADVIQSLQAAHVQRAAEHSLRLVGLGPGATPSGDDLLVGLCAGLLASGHPGAGRFARHVADGTPGRTTTLAETFLIHAGRGEFAERVHRSARAVLSGDPAEIGLSVREALAWGASSGADLLVGLLVGIEADAPHLLARILAAGSRAAAAA